MGSKFDVKARVLDNISLGGNTRRIRALAPEIAATALPGQFCMVRPEVSGDSLLRRPFSIAAVHDGGLLEFAYAVVGKGTRLLAQLEPGKNLLCLGPLGNSFPVVVEHRAIVVAGGIGVAPFPFLNALLTSHKIFPTTFYGARTSSELIYLEDLNRLSDRLVIATDDGTAGFHGFVTQALERWLEGTAPGNTVMYACGPLPMLRQVKQIADRQGLAAYLSMEEKMGCGVGICMGCPVPGFTREGQATNYLCCKDGPIFPSSLLKL